MRSFLPSPSKVVFLGLAVLVLLLLVNYAAVTMRRSGRVKLDTLLIFGDSYSDNGVSKKDPHGFKRYTDGFVWNEYVAWALELKLVNYAYSGATSDYSNKGTLWQVEKLLEDLNGSVPAGFLIGYQATGQNDFAHHVNTDPEEVAENNLQAIRQLLSAGATSIFVLNTFNVSLRPHLQGPQLTNQKFAFEEFARSTNGWLSLKLSEIPSSQRNKIIVIDFFEMSNAFGKKFLCQVYDAGIPGDSKQNYGFYDDLHPSGAAHKWFGEEIARKLRHYWPQLNGRRPAGSLPSKSMINGNPSVKITKYCKLIVFTCVWLALLTGL